MDKIRTAMEGRFKLAYDTISSASGRAYRDIYLMSNHVLNKSPFNNRFLDRILSNEAPLRESPLYAIIYKLAVYYIKSFFYFAVYLSRFVEYFSSTLRYEPSCPNDAVTILDSSFIIDKIGRSSKFNDEYFSGLRDILDKKKINYAYLPFFYSASHNRKPLELYKVFNILKREKIPVITEYQLLSLLDILKIAVFIITYPIHVLLFLRRFKTTSDESKILFNEIICTLDHVTFYSFTRYLVGRRVAKMPYKSIKIISWYENQTIHKNLYRGLRTVKDKVKIYGAQLFTYPKSCIYITADENEKQFDVIPDKIITGGAYYIPSETRLNYAIGPSLRSERLFQVVIDHNMRKNMLVLLPFFDNEAKKILRIVFGGRALSQNIIVKSHPALPEKRYRRLIPDYASLVSDDVYELFKGAKIVIGASTSMLLEAVCLGIPAISINTSEASRYTNHLLEYGKGLVWDEARSTEDLRLKITQFEYAMGKNHDLIEKTTRDYRRLFFSKVTEESAEDAFDI